MQNVGESGNKTFNRDSLEKDISVGVFEINCSDTKFLNVNETLCNLTGYSKEELLSKQLKILLNAPDAKALTVILKNSAENSAKSDSVLSCHVKKKDGSLIILRIKIDFVMRQKAKKTAILSAIYVPENKHADDFLVRKSAELPKLSSADLETQRLHRVVDTLPGHILLMDSDYNIVLTNQAYRSRFGEIREKKCYAHLFNRKTPCENCQTHYVFETKAPRRWEWRGPDGRLYNVYDFIFKDIDGKMMVLKMGWDITERRRAEEEFTKHHNEVETQVQEQTKLLVESEERFRLALKNAPVSVAVQDRKLKYVWAYDHSIINPDDIIGKTDFDLYSPEDAEYLTDLKRRVLETEKEIHEKIWINRDGRKYIDFFVEPLRNSQGEVTGVGMTSVDLTQMKLAQEALSISKEEWERTFDSVPDLISIIDKEHKIVAANKAMAKRMKLSPSQCVGKPCFSCFHKTNGPVPGCPHTLTLKDKKQHIFELHEETNNGDFLISTTPLFDSKGQLTGSVHVARDITDRKQSERALQNLVHDKEVLLREVHHRVKNNLQIVYSLINMQSRRTDNLYIKNALEDGKSRIKSMALINEILYKSDNVSKLDINKYLSELVSYLRETYRDNSKSIDVKVDIDNISLSFDTAISCGLIVNELVSNCLKYAFLAKKKGTIRVKLKLVDGSAVLSVDDDGHGLPKNLNIETADSLGLQLVCSLTKQVDGKLEVKSQKGTHFKIVFAISVCQNKE